MEEVKVLTLWPSMYGMRVLIALEEKGVKYEYQEEDTAFNKSELLLQMNPVYKKVPVLIHNGKPICESLLIFQYMDEVWGSKQFLPAKPYDRALARFWADFVDKKFFDTGARILMSKDGALEAQREMLESLQFLEGALKEMSAGGSLPFFGGSDFGYVDIAFIPSASWFHVYETVGNFKIPFETEYPLLDAWVKRCIERDSVKKSLPSSDRTLERILRLRKIFLVD